MNKLATTVSIMHLHLRLQQRSDNSQEQSDREIQILIEEKLQLLQENTQQAEMIAALESRVGSEWILCTRDLICRCLRVFPQNWECSVDY